MWLLTLGIFLPLVVQARLSKSPATSSLSAQSQRLVQPSQGTRILSSGQVKTRKGVKKARTAQGPATSKPEQLTPEQLEEIEEQMEKLEGATPANIFPRSTAPALPAAPSTDPPTAAPRNANSINAPTAPNDLVIRDSHDLTTAETGTVRDNTHEPSVANLGNTIFYTANRYAARSTDGGQTFSYVSPFTNFPSANNGFCCDQVVNAVPAQNMIVWALQYVPDANTGTLRIARAVGNEVADNFWKYYDFTPQDFGLPAGNRMDFPTLTVGTTFLYITANMHQIATNNPFTASVVLRIPLAQLAAGGNISSDYKTYNDVFSPRCAEGSTTTMYWAGLTSNNSIRIYRWDDASSMPAFDNVSLNAFTPLARDGVAFSPDGTNWAANAQTKILAAWRGNGVLGFMWPAKQCLTCNPARPYPYTIVAQFNESNRAFISQNDIFSTNFAWLYPSVAVNAVGNVGGVIGYGGNGIYPNTALFLLDDVTPTFVTPSVNAVVSTAGPFDNAWGDYLTVRQHKDNPNTFVAGVFRLNGPTVVPTHLRFGRERDFPACSFSLAPTSATPGVGGGAAGVNVMAASSCNWMAQSNTSWITITGGAPGSGNGTVNYTVAANTGGARTGSMTIAGQTFSVMQTGCSYNLTPTNQSFTPNGGAASIALTTVSGCVWTAQSNANWITVTSGNSGTGNGTIGYSVAVNNSGSPRTGSITIGGSDFTVTQSAPNLATFALAPTSSFFTNTGGTGTANVATGSGNAWTAQSNAAWITINSGSSGSGPGAVNYTVAANSTGSPRTGIVTIATIPFVVTQGAAGTLLNADFNTGIPPGWTIVDGGNGGAAASTWTAGNPGERTINAPFASNFAIMDSDFADQNNTQDEQLITPVFNAGGLAQVILEFDSQFLRLDNEIADVDVTTNGGVNWTNVLRLQNVDDGFPMPSRKTVNITGAIALNPANVQIRFRYYNASWAWWWAIDNVKVRCGYTVSPTTQTFLESSSAGNSIAVTTDAGCPWTAQSNDPSWLTITAGSSGTGTGAVTYSVTDNPGPNTRTGSLTVAGETVFIRQAAPGVPFETDFNAGLPPDWRVVKNGNGSGPTSTWTPGNPCERPLNGNFSQSFSIMDTGGNCPRNIAASTPNENLMTPGFNASDAGQVILEFSNQFRLQNPGMIGDVEVSTNGGQTWTNVLRLQGSDDGYPSTNIKTLDITSAIANNPANAQIRFRYYGNGGNQFAASPELEPKPQSKSKAHGPNSPTIGAEVWWAVDDLKVCKYKILPTSQSYSLAGGSGSFSIITGPACKWTATSAASWITLTSPANGIGIGSISYTVAANTTGASRTGSITIAGKTSTGETIGGQTFTVTQAGCPTITVNPTTLPNSAINVGYNQNITASGGAAPYNFTLVSGALPTGLSLSPGGVLSGTPNAAGTYNFTIKATDAVGCTGTRAYSIAVSTPPTISAVAASRLQGSSASSSTIANVSDADQAANTLTVTVNGGASATVNGVTVSGGSINAAGLVTASVATTCIATTAGFALSVTDSAGLSTGSTLVVTVTPNTAPTLSYNNQSAAPAGSLTINPATGPSDNGSITSIVVQNQGTYGGTIGVNNSTGVISVSNAQPSGNHSITIRATDNCGATTDATFTLSVTSTLPALGTYSSTIVTAGGNTTITPAGAPTNTVSLTATTSTNFKGTLTANPTTGVIRVTDAHVAGTYPVLLTAYNSTGASTTKTFTLTVNNPTNCSPASPTFSQPTGSPYSTSSPRALAVGDFNNDGRQDLVVDGPASGQPTLLLGIVTGGFISTSISLPYSADGIAVGDFNGDGKQDIALAATGQIVIGLGDSNGGFMQNATITVGTTPRSIVASDFNNDGKTDLAVANSGSNNVSILLGDGSGGFSQAVGSPVSAGSGPQSVAVGDFNSDGKNDLAVANSGGNVTILLGSGNGGFSQAAGSPVSAGNTPNFVAVGDFNNDGKQDLAVVNYDFNFGGVTILLGTGSGGFISGQPIGLGAGSLPSTMAIGDFNGDGQQDLAIPISGGSSTAILLGNGSGGFTDADGSPVNSGSGPYGVAVGDFNGDGKQDFAVTNISAVTVLLNNCAPTITPVAVSRQQGSTGTVSTIATVGDVETGAGLLTVAVTGTVPTGITITSISNTNGTITANVAASCTATVGANTVELTVTDGNGAMTTANLTVNVTANTGPTLTYTNQFVAPGGSLSISPATGPADNGSISTIVVQSLGTYTGTIGVNNLTGVISLSNASPNGTHTITIRATDNCGATTNAIFTLTVNLITPTLGNYPNTTIISGGNTTVTPAAAPVNATSVTAALSTNFKGTLTINPTTGVVSITNANVAGLYSVTVAAVNGSGGTATKTFVLTVANPANCSPAGFGFSQPSGSPIGVGTDPESIAVGDFNNDGIQDLVLANDGSNNVTVLLGVGGGSFTQANSSPISIGTDANSVAVGDFNSDGQQDIAVANSVSSNVAILLGNGSGSFSPAMGSPVNAGSGSIFVAVGDFDANGRQDLALGTIGNNAVTILLGNGSGGFTSAPGSPVTIGSNPLSLAIGDFNADGRQDLAVASNVGDNLTILLGDGNGGFSAAPGSPISTGDGPRFVSVGDFNADGRQDLAVANSGSNNLTILLANVGGGFSSASGSPIIVGTQPQSVIVGDIDGDGLQDLVVANIGNSVTILLGAGTGSFSQAAGSPITLFGGPSAVTMGDFNGDGKQDMAVAKAVDDVTILLNNCAPVITPSSPLTRQQGSNGSTSVIATVSDAETASGSLTVTATNVPANLLVTSIVNNNGTISADVIPTCNTAVGARIVELTVTDGNGLTSKTNLTVNIVANSPPTLTYANQSVTVGNALTINPATGPNDNGSVSTIAVQSVTPSASPGTITVNNSTGIVSVSNNLPVGVYTVTIRATDNCGATTNVPFTLTVNAIIIPTLGTYANATVNLGDSVTVTPSGTPTNTAGATATTSTSFKGVFSVNPTTGAVTVTNAHVGGTYTVTVRAVSSNGGTATRTFTLTVSNTANCLSSNSGFSPAIGSPVPVGLAPYRLAAGDFNGDGRQDLVAMNFNSNNVSVMLGNGSGGFSEATGSPILTGTSPTAAAVGDFNGDGRQDLAVANNGSNNVTILLGNGSGGFTLAPGSPVGGVTQPRAIAMSDFNSDGYQDLVVANLSPNVSILLGNGSGGFSAAAGSPVAVGNLPSAVTTGDFDGDGKPDLAVTNAASNTVTILLGSGTGGFTQPVGSPITVGNYPDAVTAGDFNGDGQQDLAVGNFNSNSVTILLGIGGGGFSVAAGSPITVATGPIFITAGNFNGDGAADLIVVSLDAENMTILLGTGGGGFSQAAGSPIGLGFRASAVTLGDFNDDGKQDLAVGSFSFNNVTVLLANCLPSIAASAPLMRRQGSVSTAATIATVSDAETPAGSLTVVATNVPANITVNGLTNTDGSITANIAALCNATAGANTVSLTVTDGNGLTSTVNLTVEVAVNVGPTLTYANQTVAPNGTLTINPATVPGDNGSIASIVVQSQGTFTGTVSVNSSGVISIGSAAPVGTHTLSIRAMDNCGAITDAGFTLTVGCPTISVMNPATTTGTVNAAFSQTFSQTGGGGATTFSLNSGTLPTGLTLATNGTLSGIPAQTGTFPITVKATDGSNCVGIGATYTLVIGCQTIIVTNPATTTGTVNAAFSQTFTQTGGVGATAFSLNSGTLPTGLTLSANGTLSGIPAQTGTFPITVKATDGNNCVGIGATYTLVIGCQTIIVTNPAITTGTVNAAFSQTFTQTGSLGATTFSLNSGTLPTGLMLSTGGVLSGTPTQAGSFLITVKVTDANGCTGTSATYALVIACQTITVTNPATSTGAVNTAFSQTFTQSDGIGTTSFSTVSTLPTGVTLSSGGVLSGTPTQTGSFPITVNATDSNGCMGTGTLYTLAISCQTITVTNPATATGTVNAAFSQTFTQTGGVGTAVFSLNSGTLPTGLTLSTGGVLSGTPIQNGTFNIAVNATDANGCMGTSATYSLTIACQTISVSPTNATLPAATMGAPYGQSFTQTGGIGTIAWSVSGGALPAGVTLNPSSGVLSGTPTTAATSTFTIRATDANTCLGERQYSLTINPSGNGLQFYPLAAPVRLLDTRSGVTGCVTNVGVLAANSTRTQAARTGCSTIPANATAIIGSITVVPSEPGFLTLFPSDATQPTVANSNFTAGEVTNNFFTVGLGATGPDAGAFKIFTSAATQVIIDLTGYYAPPGAGGLYYHPLPAPVRLLQTFPGGTGCFLNGSQQLQGTNDPNANPALDLAVDGRGAGLPSPCNSIPGDAVVLVGNATTVFPQAPFGFGYLTIYPSDATRPTVASSNYGNNDIINGPFAVKLGADGKFKVYTFSTTHLVIDISGYYSTSANDANGVGLLFNPLPKPMRLLETRNIPGFPLTGCYQPQAPIPGGAGGIRTQQVWGTCSDQPITIPNTSRAIVGNVTAINPVGAGFGTFFPGNVGTAPTVATTNYPFPVVFGYNRHYYVGLSPSDGTFKILTQFTSDYIVDVSGYFAP